MLTRVRNSFSFCIIYYYFQSLFRLFLLFMYLSFRYGHGRNKKGVQEVCYAFPLGDKPWFFP